MVINTKYDINDQLYYMRDNKVCFSYVWAIKYEETMIGGGNRPRSISYHMNPDGDFKEEVLFKTKYELLKSL